MLYAHTLFQERSFWETVRSSADDTTRVLLEVYYNTALSIRLAILYFAEDGVKRQMPMVYMLDWLEGFRVGVILTFVKRALSLSLSYFLYKLKKGPGWPLQANIFILKTEEADVLGVQVRPSPGL